MASQDSTDHDLVPTRSSSFGPQLHKISQEPTSNENKPFRFLDLPTELRNIIYDLLARENSTIGTVHSVYLKTASIDHNILRCCRQIYAEAASYVNHSPQSLVITSPSKLHNRHLKEGYKLIFYDHVRSSHVLANVVHLTLEIQICSSDTSRKLGAPKVELRDMKNLRRVDAYFNFHGCSKNPYEGSVLWAHLTRWIRYSTWAGPRNHLVVKGYLRHQHDVPGLSGSCLLGVSEDEILR